MPTQKIAAIIFQHLGWFSIRNFLVFLYFGHNWLIKSDRLTCVSCKHTNNIALLTLKTCFVMTAHVKSQLGSLQIDKVTKINCTRHICPSFWPQYPSMSTCPRPPPPRPPCRWSWTWTGPGSGPAPTLSYTWSGPPCVTMVLIPGTEQVKSLSYPYIFI